MSNRSKKHFTVSKSDGYFLAEPVRSTEKPLSLYKDTISTHKAGILISSHLISSPSNTLT
jgi:hypothetical protein